MTTPGSIAECERRIETYRRALDDLQEEEDRLLRALERRLEALQDSAPRDQDSGEPRPFLPPPDHLWRGRLEGEIAGLERSLAELRMRIEHARRGLQEQQQECWELRRNRSEAPPNHSELRAAIDDPRYWRDGDPALAHFVSDGFKLLYPAESDD